MIPGISECYSYHYKRYMRLIKPKFSDNANGICVCYANELKLLSKYLVEKKS